LPLTIAERTGETNERKSPARTAENCHFRKRAPDEGMSGPVLTNKKGHGAERAKAKRGGDDRGAKELPGRAS
jgi:hypothetical protein